MSIYTRDDPTVRELEVIRLAATGMTNKQIAADLWLQEQTIKFHITNILRKLNCKTRTEAVWKALELGFITPPGVQHCPFCSEHYRYTRPPA